MIRIFLADDHRVLLDGIQSRLKVEEDMVVVGVAESGTAALAGLKEEAIDVLVLDLDLPGKDGMEVCKLVSQQQPHIRTVILSMHGDRPHVSAALKAGAKGYVLKSRGADELVQAIRTVHQGDNYLSQELIPVLAAASQQAASTSFQPRITRREKEVLRLIVDGKSSNEIGEQLHISLKTVESHRAHLLEKLGANNTASLVRISLEKGLLSS
ncbi:MAG: response regulator transcription factor [Bacteroidota bacterium]